MRRLTWSASVVAAVLLAGACGGSDDVEPESPLDEEQAAERAEEHIADTVEVLPDSLELEQEGPDAVSAACDPEPLVTVSKWYWLRGLPAEDNEQHVDALVEYWGDNGFTVVDDLRPDDVFVAVRNDEDGFEMSVQASVQEELSIGVSSPCIHPSGVN